MFSPSDIVSPVYLKDIIFLYFQNVFKYLGKTTVKLEMGMCHERNFHKIDFCYLVITSKAIELYS